MNKTATFITFSTLAALGIIGSVVLLLLRPDASATFLSLIVTILGLVTTGAATIYGFGKQGEAIQKIERQTNGTLSALQEENNRLTRELVAAAAQQTPGEHAASSFLASETFQPTMQVESKTRDFPPFGS